MPDAKPQQNIQVSLFIIQIFGLQYRIAHVDAGIMAGVRDADLCFLLLAALAADTDHFKPVFPEHAGSNIRFLQKPYDDKGTVLFHTTTIAKLEETTPAYQSGLRPGDTIIEVNGRRILMDTDLTMEMQNDADGVLAMVVRRPTEQGSEKVSLPAVKFDRVTDADTGRSYLKYDFAILGEARTFGNTFLYSAKQELSIATVVWRTLVDMVQGDYGLNDLSGPVGTVDIIADAVGQANSLEGLRTLVMLVVMITVNLGVMNLLPLPALDGGRLVFLIVEGITRKKIPAKFEGIVHFVGLVLLLLLMLVVTYSDITKFFA